MTRDEARQATDALKSGIIKLHQLFLDIYERDGWKALGYSNFAEYVKSEFDWSKSRAYQLVDAGIVERNLRNSTTVEFRQIPESHLRQLASLPADVQATVYQQAIETAPNGEVTASHIEGVARRFVSPDEDDQYRDELVSDPGAYNWTEEPRQPQTQPHNWTDDQMHRQAQVLAGKTVLANQRCDHALIEWAKERGIYTKIDRSTQWGNPFEVDKDGSREEVILKYEDYYFMKPSLWPQLESLVGHVLGCWCYPDDCHGHVLINFMNFDHDDPYQALGFGFPIGKPEDYQRLTETRTVWDPRFDLRDHKDSGTTRRATMWDEEQANDN